MTEREINTVSKNKAIDLTEDLMKEFSSLNFEQWRLVAEKELKELKYEDLIFSGPCDLMLEPYYDALKSGYESKLSEIPHSNTPWCASVPFFVDIDTIDLLPDLVIDAAKNGIKNFIFSVEANFEKNKFEKLLRELNSFIDEKKLYYRFRLRGRFFREFISILKDYDQFELIIDVNNYFSEEFGNLVTDFKNIYRNGIWGIDTTVLHELGADDITELYSGYQNLINLCTLSSRLKTSFNKLIWMLSVDTDFMVSIAKVQLAGYLINKTLKEFGFDNQVINIEIQVFTSLKSQTTLDIHNNILRATTSTIAAILGGANTVSIYPHDFLTTLPGKDSMRLAYNIHHLLLFESYLDHYHAALNGCYAYDHLVKNMYDCFLSLDQKMKENFKNHSNTEYADGFLSGNIELLNLIKSNKDKICNRLKEKKKIKINVNKFSNDNKITKIEKSRVFGSINNRMGLEFETEEEMCFQ